MPLFNPYRRRFTIKLWWIAASLALLTEVGLMWHRSRSITLAESSVLRHQLAPPQIAEWTDGPFDSVRWLTLCASSLPSQPVSQTKSFTNAASLARQASTAHQASMASASASCRHGWRHRESLPLSMHGQQKLILVVGSASSSADETFDVTLKIEPTETCDPAKHDCLATRSSCGPNDRVEELAETCLSIKCDATDKIVERGGVSLARQRRVFFMHSRQGPLDDPASHIALDCQLVTRSASVQVYLESHLNHDEQLDGLIAEVMRLGEDVIGPAIQSLVGPVRDVDGDGRLAVVLTSQLGRSTGAFAGVDGLTRASDFRDGVPRPLGNSADVLFLNASLPPGEQLRAVLAHEWGHAAVFGRRYGRHGSPDDHTRTQAVTEDDWLNEGLAHLIEVQASGSMSNLADRVEQFLARPEAAPLIVRDYSRPEYWRHHGCRGATYLFLDWCRQHSGPDFVDRLIDGEESGIANLQAATGRSWEDLFRAWTVSLGSSLASDSGLSRHRPQPREWHSTQPGSREITLRLRGSTAVFIRLTLDGSEQSWKLVANTPSDCQLQLTAIAAE